MNMTVILLLVLLAGCAAPTPPPLDRSLARIACPALVPPIDDSFGATTAALLQLAGRYKKCRAAALGE